jgi:hypothetical protein
MSLRLCSVSVDLDPLRCYFQIHGLGAPEASLADVVLRRGLPRFFQLFAEHGVAATFFVVGSDITEHGGNGERGQDAGATADGALPTPAAAARALLKEAVSAGHELGNHSFSHPYDLSRLPRAQIEREIGDCHQALRTLTGRAPVGFRAPGYELSSDVIGVLESFGYRYDSSLFPCPPYYLAKLAVLGKMALFRQRSASIVGAPRAQLGPTQPYRPDVRQPWRHGQSAIVELPIGVTAHLRLPAIGTSLLLSDRMRRLVLSGMDRQPFFNFELHGMDLLDADTDGLPDALRARQPDLRTPLHDRMRALAEVLDHVKQRAEFAPLHIVAEKVQRHGDLLSQHVAKP